MRQKIILITLFLFFKLASCQIYYGEVVDFPEHLDMTKYESYKKITDEYGGFQFDRIGVLDFKDNEIIFTDNKSDISLKNRIMIMKLNFKNPNFKNNSTIAEICGDISNLIQFQMVDANNDYVKIQYLPLNTLPLGPKDGGLFIIYAAKKMYVLYTKQKENSTISNLYK